MSTCLAHEQVDHPQKATTWLMSVRAPEYHYGRRGVREHRVIRGDWSFIYRARSLRTRLDLHMTESIQRSYQPYYGLKLTLSIVSSLVVSLVCGTLCPLAPWSFSAVEWILPLCILVFFHWKWVSLSWGTSRLVCWSVGGILRCLVQELHIRGLWSFLRRQNVTL